ncbi:MAG: hypothetical protein JNM66_00240 [Bryobacterales bacterium]|nr:hypothetical protein [Bryobacterales bacterium]
MPYLQLLFLAHLALLVLWNWRISRRHFASDFPALFGAILLAWANLIHTAQVASVVGLLDIPLAYFGISLGLSSLYGKFFAWACPEPVPADGLGFREVAAQLRESVISVLLLAGLAVIGIGVVLLAISVLPANWDTLAYRFPRVNFYLNSGALLHPSKGLDSRLLFYPYNGSLLYLFLGQYQLTGVTWNLVSVFGWAVAGLGAFYFPLFLGGTVRAGMYSAYALLTAPIVLCLANSTNDELLAGGPLLLGVIFLFDWFRNRNVASLLFSAIGVGISVGVKLHLMFYGPGLLVAAALAGFYCRTEAMTLWKEAVRPKLHAIGAGMLLAAPLAVGFMVTNYVSSGKVTNSEFNKQVLNSPFHFGAALQNTGLLTAQLFLSPLPDHARAFGAEKGAAAYKATNELTNKTLFKNVKQGPPYTSPYYTFRGISSPNAVVFFEETLWMGMAPWALLLAILWMVLRRREYSPALWLLMLSLPLWHLALCAIHIYVECIGTYYAYAAPVGIAALGLVWERMRNSGSAAGRYASHFLVLVLVSNTLMAGTLLLSSQKRDVTQAFRVTDGETGVSQTTPSVRNAIAKAKQVYIAYTHWELLYWNLMRLNPAARYFTGDYPASAKIDLFLWPFYSQFAWDTPAPIRAGRMGEFKLLGTMSLGGEVVVCGGPTCQAECPNCEDLFLLPLRYARKGPAIDLFVAGPTQGLNPSQAGFVRFTLFNSATQANSPSAWVPLAELSKFKTNVPDQAFDHVLVETSCEAGPTCLISRTTLPLTPGLRPLVDQMPEFSPSLDPAQISSVFGNGWEGTEGSGYWKFQWKLRPGTNKLDATWTGGGGEKANDELTVSLITEKQVLIHRRSYNSYYVGTWYPSKTPMAKGYAAWDPSNIWTGKRADIAAGAPVSAVPR